MPRADYTKNNLHLTPTEAVKLHKLLRILEMHDYSLMDLIEEPNPESETILYNLKKRIKKYVESFGREWLIQQNNKS